MSKLEKLDIEEYLYLFPFITAVLVIIATLIPAISINVVLGILNLSGNIYLWGFEDGNIVSTIGGLGFSSWAPFIILPVMLFGISLAVSATKLILLGIKLYKKEETFADNDKKWLKQGIMIIVHGILVIIIASVVFQGIIGALLGEIATQLGITPGQFYSIGPGVYLLFAAGVVCLVGFGLGKKFSTGSTTPRTRKAPKVKDDDFYDPSAVD